MVTKTDPTKPPTDSFQAPLGTENSDTDKKVQAQAAALLPPPPPPPRSLQDRLGSLFSIDSPGQTERKENLIIMMIERQKELAMNMIESQ
ncbi:MAG: hypothetical protein LVR00_08075 [Rhabdochlamydiaceae bacterium]|jgi:hypothetical protein